METFNLSGTKIVEIPYFSDQLVNKNGSVLIIGERHGGEGVSEAIKEKGMVNVTTTDILSVKKDSWLDKNQGEWKHIQADFAEFDESNKYDYVISVSVFEHFGFWIFDNRMANGKVQDDYCLWNHDLVGINKACKLLNNLSSKLIITLPAGPYMNYEPSGKPFLRYYDFRRQQLIKEELVKNGFIISDEKFYYSENFVDWKEVDGSINNPQNYHVYNYYTPNVIWGFTIQKNYAA
jgi:hypothetical protein